MDKGAIRVSVHLNTLEIIAKMKCKVCSDLKEVFLHKVNKAQRAELAK